MAEFKDQGIIGNGSKSSNLMLPSLRRLHKQRIDTEFDASSNQPLSRMINEDCLALDMIMTGDGMATREIGHNMIRVRLNVNPSTEDVFDGNCALVHTS